MSDGVMDMASAARRSQAYGFFAALMEYPEGELTTLIRDGTIARRARELLCAVYPQLTKEFDWSPLRDAGEADDLSIEYTRLFNLPGPGGGPCCSLNSSTYDSDSRMKLLEELVRFYNFFGLTSGDAPANELPDHLTTQFEFLHFLCAREACDETETVDDYRRAQRDFLEHHPGKWVPQWHARLRDNHAPPFYLALGELLDRFIQMERQHLGELAGQATTH